MNNNIKNKMLMLMNNEKVSKAKSWYHKAKECIDKMQNPKYMEVEPNFTVMGIPSEIWWDEWVVMTEELPLTPETKELYKKSNVPLSFKRHGQIMAFSMKMAESHMVYRYTRTFLRQRVIIFIMAVLLVLSSIGLTFVKTYIHHYQDKRDGTQIEELQKNSSPESREKIMELKQDILDRNPNDAQLKEEILRDKASLLQERAMKGEDVKAEMEALQQEQSGGFMSSIQSLATTVLSQGAKQ